jgi:hypothetical protein
MFKLYKKQIKACDSVVCVRTKILTEVMVVDHCICLEELGASIFYYDEGSSRFLWNINNGLQDCKVAQPIK